MHIPHQCFTQAAKEVQKYYEAADEVEQSIIKHSVTAGALALVPLPGIAEVAMLIAQIRMYKRIHEITGVKFFSDQVFWNIGKFICVENRTSTKFNKSQIVILRENFLSNFIGIMQNDIVIN